MKKVRFRVPYFIKEKIKEDEGHFNLLAGGMGNKIFAYYSNKEIEEQQIKFKNEESIQFNLNKENDEIYYITLKEHKVENEADFFRNLFLKYLNNPRYLREQILFEDVFKKIEKAIQEKKKINIKYMKEIRTVNPYFIKTSPGEDRSYLFCYCEKNQEFRNYRIANIENVMISKNDVEIKNEEYIKNIDKNFDAFLSYGKNIKIQITKTGEKLFERALLNRPKVIEKNGNIWELQCTNRLAEIYFPQFLSEVKILEPKELREWFKKEIERTKKLYDE